MPSNFLIVFVWFLVIVPSITSKKHPHIVFILADDLGYNDLGYSAYSDSKTPYLDKLVRESLNLNHSYTHSICTPSRSALFTGIYPFRYGLHRAAIESTHAEGLDTKYTLLPKYLKEDGYETHLVGKWHLGLCKEAYLPTSRGFDSFRGIYGGHTDYYTHKETESNLLDYWQDKKLIVDNKVYCTDDYADYATKLIEEKGKEKGNRKPMFLFLSLQAVHAPLKEPPHSELDKGATYREIMREMIKTVDDFTNRTVTALKAAEIWDDTVLVFSSDNGGSPDLGGNNYPLRGVKHTLYEGGTRVRSFIKGPGIAQGHYTGLVHVTDWLPTLVSLAGGKVPKGLDGVDQSHAFKTNPDKLDHQPRKEFFYNVDRKERMKNEMIDASAVRYRVKDGNTYRDYKLILGDAGRVRDRIKPSYRPSEGSNENFADNYFPDGILFNMKYEEDIDLESQESVLTDHHAIKEKMINMIKNELDGNYMSQNKTEVDSGALKQKKHGVKYLGPGWC